MRNNKSLIILTIVALSLLMGGYQTYLNQNGYGLSLGLSYTWTMVSYILFAMWVVEDSKSYSNIYRPYEYGYLVFLFSLVYLPYYFIKTRGWFLGVAILMGMLLLINIGSLFSSVVLQWVSF